MRLLKPLLPAILFFISGKMVAQDTTNLMNELESESLQSQTRYATATFKSTRIIDGHSVENLPAHVLDVRISHRFGPLSSGLYNFFGLDNATMRLGFDYGIANNFMIGVGHSTFQKTYDGYFKLRLLRQSSGEINMPFTVSFMSSMAVNTLTTPDSLKIKLGDRSSYVFQLLIGRKFSDLFSLQIMPTLVNADNISFNHPKDNILAIGIGGRLKLSKRISLNSEYYYQLPNTKAPGAQNVLSFGVDIGTGGHVFQLHFTNSVGQIEKLFIAETTGRWDNSDVLFGFNISRVFQLNNKSKKKW